MPEFFHFNAVKRKIVYEDVEREIVHWLFEWISRDRALTMAPPTSQLYLWCGILIAFLTVIQNCHTGIWTFLINKKLMSISISIYRCLLDNIYLSGSIMSLLHLIIKCNIWFTLFLWWLSWIKNQFVHDHRHSLTI